MTDAEHIEKLKRMIELQISFLRDEKKEKGGGLLDPRDILLITAVNVIINLLERVTDNG